MSPKCSVNVAAWWMLLWAIVPTVEQRRAFDVNVLDFDVNDIFDERLTPMQIFSQQLQTLLRLRKANWSFNSDAEQSREIKDSLGTTANASTNTTDLNTAFIAMKYHRKMMNEFMAASYITETILDGWPASKTIYHAIGKRMGVAQNDSTTSGNNSIGYKSVSVPQGPQEHLQKHRSNHRLLDDEGSLRYKSWLEKMATLEDIYRQFDGKDATIPEHQNMKKPKKTPVRRQTFFLDSASDATQADDQDQDFDDGDITGYALTNNPYDYPSLNTGQNKYWSLGSVPSVMQLRQPNVKAINKNGYENGYDEYGAHPPASSYSHSQPKAQPSAATSQIKEIGLKDITDIALTTLAFLSFGMFILQVLICITMGKDDTSNLMMMPMEGAEVELPADGIEEIRRKRRSIPNQSDRLIMMNELARRALFSIDAVLLSRKDDGSCHYWTLCANNQYAKRQSNGQQFWIPIWSLGMSWLSSRLLPVSSEYFPIINSLKAIVTGMGNGDCKNLMQACKLN